MEKALLLIDDTKEYIGVLGNISNHLSKRESVNVTTKYLNPNSRDYFDENKDPSLPKVLSGVSKKLSSLKPSLIIVDQYYSGNDNFDGLKIIEELRKISKFKNCPIFLISGKRDKIVRDIFSIDGVKDKEKVKQLSKIISFKIDQFLDKNFKDEAIALLKNNSISDILPSKLREFENVNAQINVFSPKHKVYSFSELSDLIENNHPDSVIILDEIFDMTLSHYIELNEKL
ncbi:hypothetical protein H0I29_11345 [Polaribacter sp. R2A056_3_33]|uniref:hypothetical protein n=1 Tax=Polaribacter sp. R2A056_3_33 TaxID=2745563 RepID=UPI001C4F0F59|nr:hypothetical protein [Polaribacter sp. R2A056_3_33]QXP69226.1 hypothetical protein H0I29_11345 [Polaribacter sp. R2A056_3_33]